MIIFYVTCKDKQEANKIAKYLVEKRLVACANIFPIESLYWWKGKLTEDKEFVLIAKTFEEKSEEVKGEIKKIHSYEIPCILQFDIKANKEYEDWAKEEVR